MTQRDDIEVTVEKRVAISFDGYTFAKIRDMAVRKGIGFGAQVRELVKQALQERSK